jgi:hypothetical protein
MIIMLVAVILPKFAHTELFIPNNFEKRQKSIVAMEDPACPLEY